MSLFFLLLCSFYSYSAEGKSLASSRGAYIGVIGGYGSTTWSGLVPRKENQNSAIALSTPINVKEGGGVWGLLAGYEFIRAFALEASYLCFPKAKVFFSPDSLFSFENNDSVKLRSKTKTVNLMAKVMLPISNTSFRLYSSAGIVGIYREDMLLQQWRFGPTFEVGLNCFLSQHVMAEVGGNYTAGYGESQLSPSDSYFPFLYSITARLSYHF